MNVEETKRILGVAKQLQDEANTYSLPPEEIIPTRRSDILVYSLFENTRDCIKKIVSQINKCYAEGCYDACAVMIRRLVEVLTIETFDAKRMIGKIKDANDNFFFLEELINKMLEEKSLNLSRHTKNALKKKEIKTVGDQSAHGRYYNAYRQYIDEIKTDLRIITNELLCLSGLKK